MNTTTTVAVHMSSNVVRDPSAYADQNCIDCSDVAFGPHLMEPADELINGSVPRACLQLWAGIDRADVQAAAGSFQPLSPNALRISHVRELIDELAPATWRLHYGSAGSTDAARHRAMYVWLSRLGVPLPEFDSVTKQSFGHLHRRICKSLESMEGAAAVRKKIQRAKLAGRLQHLAATAAWQMQQQFLSQLPAEEMLLDALPKQLSAVSERLLPSEDTPPSSDATPPHTPPASLPVTTLATAAAREVCKIKELKSELEVARATNAQLRAERDEACAGLQKEQQLRFKIDEGNKELQSECDAQAARLASNEAKVAAWRIKLANAEHRMQADRRSAEERAARDADALEALHVEAAQHAERANSLEQALDAAERRAAEVEAVAQSERKAAAEAMKTLSAKAKRELKEAVQRAEQQFATNDSRNSIVQRLRDELELARMERDAAEDTAGRWSSACDAASELLEQQRCATHAMSTQLGISKAQVQALRSAEERRVERAQSMRKVEAAHAAEREQREALLTERKTLHERIATLECEAMLGASQGRGQRACRMRSDGTDTITVTSLRRFADGSQVVDEDGHGAGGQRADAFAVEMCRRLVEECHMTFEAAATANLLVLSMHMRAQPPVRSDRR